MKIFKKNKILFRYHDQFFKKIDLNFNTVLENKSLKIKRFNLEKFDGVLIIADHDNVNYDFIFKNSKKIFDTKNLVSKKYKKYMNKTIKL